MQGLLTSSLTSNELNAVAEDFWRYIWPKKGTRKVVISSAVAEFMPETECLPLVDLVVVFLGGRRLFSLSFLPHFRFSPAPAITQDSKLISTYSVTGEKRVNRGRKGK